MRSASPHVSQDHPDTLAFGFILGLVVGAIVETLLWLLLGSY